MSYLVPALPPCVPNQGEESVKERFTLDESKVVPFLEQEYTLEEVGQQQ
jgi:hypothetical protein